MSKFQTIKPVLIRSLIVACVVGPILILINQFDAFIGGASVNYSAAALTMIVPFCVSTFSGLLSQRASLRHLSTIQQQHADELKKQSEKFLEQEALLEENCLERLAAQEVVGLAAHAEK